MNLNLGDTQLIIAEAKKQGLLRNQLAYVLATAYHETAHTMKPITEMGGQAYLKAKKYYPYIGRGYVQLTWDYNYKKASKSLGVDFIKDPSLLLQSKYSVPILITGMREGWFTTKKLNDYITLYKSDFTGARKIINNVDKASLIAGYAKDYDQLLRIAGYGLNSPEKPVQSIPVVPAPTPPLDHVPVVRPPVTFLEAIMNIIKSIFGRKS
jgi:hypothetical protein